MGGSKAVATRRVTAARHLFVHGPRTGYANLCRLWVSLRRITAGVNVNAGENWILVRRLDLPGL